MAVTIYKSDDVGAPLLTPTLGSFNAMLKACLVDGYDVKLGAGWTVGAENIVNGETIFSNTDSKHFWVRHDAYATTDKSGTSVFFRRAFIKGIESFTDIDTHFGNYPNMIGDANTDMPTTNIQALSCMLCLTESFGSGIPWILIADGKSVILNILIYEYGSATPTIPLPANYSNTPRSYSFGSIGLNGSRVDVNTGYLHGFSWLSDDVPTSYEFGLNSASATAANHGKFLQRNYAGDTGAIEFNTRLDGVFQDINLAYMGGGCNTDIWSSSLWVKYPTLSNEVLMSKVAIVENRLAIEHVVDPDPTSAIRGYVRGVYGLGHSIRPTAPDNIGIHGDTFTSGGRTYILLLNHHDSITTSMAVDITGPW